MGNQDGIVSGLFTAVWHAIFALAVLFFARGGDSPYTSVIVVSSVVMLVCSVGLIVRSHFSCLLLLLLDLLVVGLAIAWCISAVVALRHVPGVDQGRLSHAVGQIGNIATLTTAAMAILLSLWLTRRTYRLERRLRWRRQRDICQ